MKNGVFKVFAPVISKHNNIVQQLLLFSLKYFTYVFYTNCFSFCVIGQPDSLQHAEMFEINDFAKILESIIFC